MNLPKKYVLTGGPCTGKTTLIKFLKTLGYQVVTEVAPIIMREERAKGKTIPWQDLVYFQNRVLDRQLHFESKLNLLPSAFVDRGALDSLAYFGLFKTTPSKDFIDKVLSNKYEGVFLLDFLPFYRTNVLRIESLNIAKEIHRLLKKTYLKYGYKVISVPALDVSKRANFVCNRIDGLERPKIFYSRIKSNQL